ncbi:MAG: prepilin-type N-terminal cleavage/methylation domain-containing protein [Verrucomicrobiota bacterium]|nr:prepilin-type N-terminal cleavage/methylation domain-containing protein [Verrucomicrobiota bacterium]
MGRRIEAFTLIEMLVVIAIIGVLLGLMLPVVMHSRKKARVARAKREVKELDEAWKAYLLSYKTFPPMPIAMMDSNALSILRGVTADSTNAHPNNPWNIPFLDVRTNTIYYCDPWGVPNTTKGVYKVALDTDMDNRVQLNGGGPWIGVNVAVWSDGPDGVSHTADDICSWKE